MIMYACAQTIVQRESPRHHRGTRYVRLQLWRASISYADSLKSSGGVFPYTSSVSHSRYSQISDPFVLRILINQARIEKMFLAKTRREGEDMLRSYGRAGTAWTADGFLLRRFPYAASIPIFARCKLIHLTGKEENRIHLLAKPAMTIPVNSLLVGTPPHSEGT